MQFQKLFSYSLKSHWSPIDLFRILGIEMELACNGGSCEGISLKIFACEKIASYESRLQASSSSIPRIRNRPIESNQGRTCLFITVNKNIERAFPEIHNSMASTITKRHIPFLVITVSSPT